MAYYLFVFLAWVCSAMPSDAAQTSSFVYGDEFQRQISDHMMMKFEDVYTYNQWSRRSMNGITGQAGNDPNANTRIAENTRRVMEQLQKRPDAFFCNQEISKDDVVKFKTTIESYNTSIGSPDKFKVDCQKTGGESFENCLVYNEKYYKVIQSPLILPATLNLPELDSVSYKNQYVSGDQRGRYLFRGFQTISNGEKVVVINAHLAWAPDANQLVNELNKLAARYFGAGFSRLVFAGDVNTDLTHLASTFHTPKVSIGTNGSVTWHNGLVPKTNDAIVIYDKGSSQSSSHFGQGIVSSQPLPQPQLQSNTIPHPGYTAHPSLLPSIHTPQPYSESSIHSHETDAQLVQQYPNILGRKQREVFNLYRSGLFSKDQLYRLNLMGKENQFEQQEQVIKDWKAAVTPQSSTNYPSLSSSALPQQPYPQGTSPSQLTDTQLRDMYPRILGRKQKEVFHLYRSGLFSKDQLYTLNLMGTHNQFEQQEYVINSWKAGATPQPSVQSHGAQKTVSQPTSHRGIYLASIIDSKKEEQIKMYLSPHLQQKVRFLLAINSPLLDDKLFDEMVQVGSVNLGLIGDRNYDGQDEEYFRLLKTFETIEIDKLINDRISPNLRDDVYSLFVDESLDLDDFVLMIKMTPNQSAQEFAAQSQQWKASLKQDMIKAGLIRSQ